MPGLALAAATAALATAISTLSPLLSAPMVGILLGIAGATVRAPTERWRPGLALAGGRGLRVAVVFFGTGLSLGKVARLSSRALPVLILILLTAAAATWFYARLLKVEGNVRTLIGVGSAVCGTSAISAVTPLIAASQAEIACAVGSILLFNTAAVVLFPLLGHLLGMSQNAFGLWSGTAIHDTSSVVAAAYGYGHIAGQTALVTKLTRTLAIVPICLTLAVHRSPAPADGTTQDTKPTRRRPPLTRLVPLFLLGFLAAVTINSLGAIPHTWHPALAATANYLAALALSAIGLSLCPRDIRAAGARPLLLTALVWLTIAALSLLLYPLTHLL
ncbi:YeiH family protein [Streptomyces sp. NPDC093097]|uniref:YeiH family protein n=1 Tax=Streptomyces sp. NPDC093097 TaxID=3366027 RepID=UPI003824A82F